VADTGPGVPPMLMHRMFEPFFTTKAPGQGSGMGLATVHGIVHEHGGHIVVENRAAGGACFRVILPPCDAVADVDSAAPCPPGGARADAALRGRVLLVDDDDTARGYMTELLQAWGLEVVAFDDPIPARAAAGGAPPFDVAILDYTMPHMTGLELARDLRSLPQAPMLFLYSGFTGGLDDARLAEAGIRARLSKPVNTAELFRHLEMALGQG
jgi:CheY-like chemotaxis protein